MRKFEAISDLITAKYLWSLLAAVVIPLGTFNLGTLSFRQLALPQPSLWICIRWKIFSWLCWEEHAQIEDLIVKMSAIREIRRMHKYD
jgi:hypothetical protein